MKGRKREPEADKKTQRQREVNRRAYAKRGSKWSEMTEEQKARKLERVKLWKQRRKQQLATGEPVKIVRKHRAPEFVPNINAPPGSEAWHLAMKEKHKAFEGTRLEKSQKQITIIPAERGVRKHQ